MNNLTKCGVGANPSIHFMHFRWIVGAASVLAWLCVSACEHEGREPTMKPQTELSVDIELPPAAPSINGMTLLRDDEIAALLIGKRVEQGAISFFDNYLPGGKYVEEMDLGLIRTGIYRISQNAMCTRVALGAHFRDTGPTCLRFYKAESGDIYKLHVGHEGPPSILKIVGPTPFGDTNARR